MKKHQEAKTGVIQGDNAGRWSFFRKIVAVKPLSREGDEPTVASGA